MQKIAPLMNCAKIPHPKVPKAQDWLGEGLARHIERSGTNGHVENEKHEQHERLEEALRHVDKYDDLQENHLGAYYTRAILPRSQQRLASTEDGCALHDDFKL